MGLDYEIWDVFADRPLEGNPLALVWDADALSTDAMQALAKEFNLAETVFILTPTKADCAARLRIFTPAYEMPYAGHPTVGASVALGARRGLGDAFQLQLNAGVFDITHRDGAPARAAFVNPNLPLETGRAPTPEAVARAVSLPADAIEAGAHGPRRIGAGVDFVYAKAALADVRRAALDTGAFEALALGDAVGLLLYADGEATTYHVRMFAPGAGVPEDPATGSAAAALPGQIALAGGLGDGAHVWSLAQGVEMGRPSRIDVAIDASGGAPKKISVGGAAVRVIAGRIEADFS